MKLFYLLLSVMLVCGHVWGEDTDKRPVANTLFTTTTSVNFDSSLNGQTRLKIEYEGDIIFMDQAGETIRLCKNGDFKVRGRKIAKDMELYRAFKKWIKSFYEE